MGIAASSSARTERSEPFPARPIGVRIASTITASGIAASGSVQWSLEAEAPHAALAPAEVVGEFVPDGPGDLGAQQVGVESEVRAQGGLGCDDPVGEAEAR